MCEAREIFEISLFCDCVCLWIFPGYHAVVVAGMTHLSNIFPATPGAVGPKYHIIAVPRHILSPKRCTQPGSLPAGCILQMPSSNANHRGMIL